MEDFSKQDADFNNTDTFHDFHETVDLNEPKDTDTSFNIFAAAAKSLGIFSLFSVFFSIFFLTFICAGLAIIFAVISKGYENRMSRRAIIGFTTGLLAIVLQIAAFTFAVYNILHVPEIRERFYSGYEQMYGEPIEDSIQDFIDTITPTQIQGGTL